MSRKWWLISLVFLIIIAVIIGYYLFKHKKTGQVIIGGKTLNVELAQSENEYAKGLSGRDNLDASSGMLFVFPKSNIYTFWMKDTKIPLDIIWLAPSKVEGMYKIVEMTTLTSQNDNDIPQFTPKIPANYVLELNAGFVDKNNIKVGDEVEIKI